MHHPGKGAGRAAPQRLHKPGDFPLCSRAGSGARAWKKGKLYAVVGAADRSESALRFWGGGKKGAPSSGSNSSCVRHRPTDHPGRGARIRPPARCGCGRRPAKTMRTARWISLRLASPWLPSARQALDPGGEGGEEKAPASLQRRQLARALQCSAGAAPSPAHGDSGTGALVLARRAGMRGERHGAGDETARRERSRRRQQRRPPAGLASPSTEWPRSCSLQLRRPRPASAALL